MSTILPIVEGHGEQSAIPIVFRRYQGIRNPPAAIQIHRPIRVSRSLLVKPGELERAVRFAKIQVADCVPFVLIDADEDCPAELGPALTARARAIDPSAAVVIAKWEFEAWFIASIESLSGQHGLQGGLAVPANLEEISGAKEWLSSHMVNPANAYAPTVDQPSFANDFDFDLARAHSPSFDKFLREADRVFELLVSRLAQQQQQQQQQREND